MKRWNYKKWRNNPDLKVVTREGLNIKSLGWYCNSFVGTIENGKMICYDEITGKPFGSTFMEQIIGTPNDLFFEK